MSDRAERLRLADDVFLRAHVTFHCTRCKTDTEYPPGVMPTDICRGCRDRELELARDVINAARRFRCKNYIASKEYDQLLKALLAYDQRTGEHT